MKRIYSCGLNKGFSFPDGYQLKQTPEKSWIVQQLKCYDDDYQDEDISQNKSVYNIVGTEMLHFITTK